MSRMEDMATDIEMATREAAIARARRPAAENRAGLASAHICPCGEPIPEDRRTALQGVQNCIECARNAELKRKIYRE